MTTPNTTTPTPAASATPATNRPRSFGKIGASKPATDPAATEAGDSNTGDGTPNAEVEQENPAAKLTTINFEEAMAHSSEGLARGVIRSVAPTKSGNGILVGVAHEDGSYATFSFNMFRVEKINGQPKIDQATGKPVTVADVQAQKAYGEFCRAFGVSAQELTQTAIAYAAKQSPEKPPLVGVEAMWDFVYSGTFLNAKYNADATAAMRNEGAAE